MLLRKGRRQFENSPAAGCIIVCAKVDLVLLPFAFKRADFTKPEMIVMRPDQDILMFGAVSRRQEPDHVSIGLPDLLDRRGDFHIHPWQRKSAFGMRIFFVERRLEVSELFAR